MIPLRFTELGGAPKRLLFTADNGKSFLADSGFLSRYIEDRLRKEDRDFLTRIGLPVGDETSLSYAHYLFLLAQRSSPRWQTDYFMLVPTLRCNLACRYCQVSRVNINAVGFDWSDEIRDKAIDMIVARSPERVKVEFQGGEPTLRLDIVTNVIDALEARGKSVEAVLCTNLAELSMPLERLIDRGNVYISTSIDGSLARQAAQRMGSDEAAARFFNNVDWVIKKYGSEKLSALPTIDPDDPPSFDELYRVFASRGINSIFLRPINFQGFARKRYPASREPRRRWREYYRGFIAYLIDKGEADDYAVSEFYFTQCLRRIFRANENSHVNLRNPSVLGLDYLVINYDGRLFPTDEARMLDRIGEIDLSLGDVWRGVDTDRRDQLNQTAFNDEDPDCIHCAFQPFCGGDLVDAISRYGRVDMPCYETAFCQNQLDIFDLIFSMLAEPSPKERAALSRWLGLIETPEQFLGALDD